jgi:hypothetical protein
VWIAIVVIAGGVIYLAWCLIMGKILVTLGTNLHKKTRLVDRDDNPKTFWTAWVISAGALIIFTVFLIRTAMG